MNRLPISKQVRVLHCLFEGMGMNAAGRVCDVAKNTVANLVRDVGIAAMEFHDHRVHGLAIKNIQADEIVTIVYSKQRVAERFGTGYNSTWIAIEPATKFIVSWHTGYRTRFDAEMFLRDVSSRCVGKVRIATDAYASYQPEIAEAFGCRAKHDIMRKGDVKPRSEGKVHTSFVERMNKTIRGTNSRFIRRGQGFSKSFSHHQWMLAAQLSYYNFCRIHSSLRVTPAMQIGLEDHVWSIQELLMLSATRRKKAGTFKVVEIAPSKALVLRAVA